jgi:glycyl-tRNA synthetase beta chain
MKPLLLEIGTEEIPARFLTKGIASLKEEFIRLLNKASIGYEKIFEYATPRRLTIYIEKVSERQKDRTIQHLGPPKKIAFDDKGTPTDAAFGFARSMNVDVKKLKVVKTDRGEYVAVTVKEKGRMTKDVLSEALPGLISSLQFPKTMRWGDSTVRFVRPIRWILALYGNELIPFELDGVKSSNISYGHRFMAPGVIKVENPSDYLSLLLKNYVVADPKERKKIILDEIEKIELTMDCKVHKDEELLDTVTSLVEYPTVVLGGFDNEYLSLPRGLLITVLRNYQKCFSIEDKKDNLLPHFIVISNTRAENNDTVRKGAERVLRARLEDARFYFNEDQKKPLQNYVEKLKGAAYHEKLGNLYEKVERITSLAVSIGTLKKFCDPFSLEKPEDFLDRKKFEFNTDPKITPKKEVRNKWLLGRASMLCKADLMTGIVREFPELQGYMGKIYALNSGEDEEVASAIYEHYLPRFPGDALPSSEIGTIISLADKLDNIASFFHLGLVPTGSEDPFALRRQASGVINILQDRDYPLSLDILVEKSLQGLKGFTPSLMDKILKFFSQRLEGILSAQGYSHDLINAVLSTKRLNIKDLKHRIEVLSSLKKDPQFPELLIAAKRVYNILVKTQPKELQEELLIEPAEKGLFNIIKEAKEKLKNKEFRALFELKNPINTFFDNVLVMDERMEIRENRLALLTLVKGLFDSLGDFSKLITDAHNI